MISALFATATIFLILVLSEFLWRKARVRGEFARKFVHIIAGSFIAFLPFWVSYGWIIVLAAGFIFANLVNRYTEVFHAIHAITRKSWGDLLFGISILLMAVWGPNKWLFTGAILQVALADGLAAVIGTHYSKKRYKVFDHYKSVIGTLAYFAASFAIMVFIVKLGALTSVLSNIELFLVASVFLTLLENVSGYGLDNISLPLGFLVLVKGLGVI